MTLNEWYSQCESIQLLGRLCSREFLKVSRIMLALFIFIKVCWSLGLQGIPSYFSKCGQHSFLIFLEPSCFFWLNGSMIFTRLSSWIIIISRNTSYKSKNWSLFFQFNQMTCNKISRWSRVWLNTQAMNQLNAQKN